MSERESVCERVCVRACECVSVRERYVEKGRGGVTEVVIAKEAWMKPTHESRLVGTDAGGGAREEGWHTSSCGQKALITLEGNRRRRRR